MNVEWTPVYSKLIISEANAMRKSGAILEGMIPKVSSEIAVMGNNLNIARALNGNIEHNFILELFVRDGVETMIP